MKNKFIIKSNDNLDWNGKWFRGPVEDEMKELGYNVREGFEWIVWLLGRVFNGKNSLHVGIGMAIACSEFKKIFLSLPDGDVEIELC